MTSSAAWAGVRGAHDAGGECLGGFGGGEQEPLDPGAAEVFEDLSLVVAEIEVEGHVSYSRGRPRMRSAIMLRWISAVPPAIVSL